MLSNCAYCLASFSPPLLQWDSPAEGDQTDFVCRSSGGFPEPAVYWLINDTEEPPTGSVRTLTVPLTDSPLYNITSHLTVNISQGSSVSCVIENMSINETLISTSYGVHISPVVNRATEAMWIFSTALCVVVGVMVLAALVYQIHLDRTHKKHHQGYRHKEETAVMDLELLGSLSETNV
ncbi:ICOS ligand-like [Diretmus argenteus]